MISFRLGGSDGVSIVAARWAQALRQQGLEIVTIAGEGPVDRLVPGLAIDAAEPPRSSEFADALAGIDVAVVENLCTIPLNLPASRVVGNALRGFPAVMHHHDPPWQRARFAHIDELPMVDEAWRHVTINELTRRQMAERGIRATTIYNPFDTTEPFGDRDATRAALGIGPADVLVAHPVRAIARKNIPAALELTEDLGGTYWLLGRPEEGYDDELAKLLSTARVPVIHRGWAKMADVYAAADVVAFPSLWEGFGNPPIEASIHRRPVIVGDYPVAHELASLGFRWFACDEIDQVRDFVARPDQSVLDRNRALALERFSIEATGGLIARLMQEAGWL